MEIDKERQAQALYEISRRLDLAERERANQRFLNGVIELERHNFLILANDEFVERLPSHLSDLESQGKHEPVRTLLATLGSACCATEQKVRERALVVLSVFSDQVLESGRHEYIREIAGILINWLEVETEYFSGFGIICQQLQKIGLNLLTNTFWHEADALLSLLKNIQDGSVEKSNAIKGMAAKTQENLATRDVLEGLTSIYLHEEDDTREHAAALLKKLGRRATIFLLNRLMHCETKEERFRLLRLLPDTGQGTIAVFEECLKKNPPWYVIRNIIFMISEIGDGSFYFLVEPYLAHPDIRVQQQVIICIGILGGPMMQKRLLTALGKVHDDLKIPLVMKLGRCEGEDVATALLDLLDRRGSFSVSVAEELLLTLCVALKSFPTSRTVKDIKQLIAERKKTANESDRILAVAEEVLSVVEPAVRHEAKGEIHVIEELSFDSDPVVENTAKKKIRDFLAEVQGIIGQGNVGKASDMLYAEAVKAAREKDFRAAEMLRDKLLEINPMALSEVLEVGEIIEEERSTAVSGHHIETWSTLYEAMTTEEFNALYQAMRHITYNPEEIIVKSGETDPSLFFVNSGLVRLSCLCGNKETFLKRLPPGEIVGVGQFFSVSVWTVSLVAQTVAQVNVLARERFLALKEKFPALEAKLYDFCLQYDIVPRLLRMTGGDRREYARYPAPIFINTIMLDPYGKRGQRSITGQMIDLSQGGLSFSIRMSQRKNATMLLGRQIIAEIPAEPGETARSFGIVVGVGCPQLPAEDFVVHLKFSSLLAQADVLRISKLAA